MCLLLTLESTCLRVLWQGLYPRTAGGAGPTSQPQCSPLSQPPAHGPCSEEHKRKSCLCCFHSPGGAGEAEPHASQSPQEVLGQAVEPQMEADIRRGAEVE